MTSSLGYELRRLADLDDSGTAAVTTPSDSQTSRRRAVLSNIRNTMSGTPASNAKPNKAEHREAGAKAEGGGARVAHASSGKGGVAPRTRRGRHEDDLDTAAAWQRGHRMKASCERRGEREEERKGE